MERRLVPAVSPYADAVGYPRAVRAGNHIFDGRLVGQIASSKRGNIVPK